VSQTFGDPTGTAAVPSDDNQYAVSCGMRCDVANGQQGQPLVEPADGSGAVVNDYWGNPNAAPGNGRLGCCAEGHLTALRHGDSTCRHRDRLRHLRPAPPDQRSR
jgi:hypothetical protein